MHRHRTVILLLLVVAVIAAGDETTAAAAGDDDGDYGDDGGAVAAAAAESTTADPGAASAADVAAVTSGDMQPCSCQSATTTCTIGPTNSSERASPRSCTCSPCPAPAHGTGVCNNGMCDVRCKRGFTRTVQPGGRGYACSRTVATIESECGCVASTGACLLQGSALPPNSTLLQGAGCPCSACGASTDPNAVPSCGEDRRCTSVCVAGTFRCDASKQCLAAYASDPLKCGESCKACPSPPNGRAACEHGMCSVVCHAGYVRSIAGGGLNCVPASEASAVVFCSDSSRCPFGDMWVGGYGVLSGFDRSKGTWTMRHPQAYIYGMAIVGGSSAVAVGGPEYWLWSKTGARGAWVMSRHDDNAQLWGVAAGKDLRGRDIVWMVGDHGGVVGLDHDGAPYSNSLAIEGSGVFTARLADVTASGPDAAVAVGSDGGIALLSGGIKSNAGWKWARPPSAGAPDLTAVSGWGTNGRATVLWAVGRRATVLVSRDQGRSWSQVPHSTLGVPADTDLFGVTAVSGAEAWVVGARGTILHYTAPSRRYSPSGTWSRASVPGMTQDLYTAWVDWRYRTPVVWAAGGRSVLLARASAGWKVIQRPSAGAYYAGATPYQLGPRAYSADDANVTAAGQVEPASAIDVMLVDERCTFSEKQVQKTAKVAAGNSIMTTVTYPLCPNGSPLSLATCHVKSSGQVSCSGAESGCALIRDPAGAFRYAWFSRLDSSGAPVQSSGGDDNGQVVEQTLSSVSQLIPCVMPNQLQWPTGTLPTPCNGSPAVGNSYVDPTVLSKAGSCSSANPTLFTDLVRPSASWRQPANVGVNAMLLRFGMLSHMAYSKSDADVGMQVWSQCLQPPGYRQLDWVAPPGWLFNTNGSAQVHIYFDDTNLIFAYRGSDADESQDWWTNADTSPTPVVLTDTSNGARTTVQVHDGFYTATLGLNAKISAFIASIGGPSRRTLWFTGHSQGGALAILGAMTVPRLLYGDSSKSYTQVGGVIPFAAPYVGDAAFRKYYNPVLGDKTARVQYWLDPVPWAYNPATPGYYHVGFALEICGKRPSWYERFTSSGLEIQVIALNADKSNCPYNLPTQVDLHHHSISGTVNAMLLLGKEKGFAGISVGGSVGCVLAMGSQCPQELTAPDGVNCDNVFRCNWASNARLCRFCPGATTFDADKTCATFWGMPRASECKVLGYTDSYRCVAPK